MSHVRPALVLLALFSVLTGLIYPLSLTLLANTLMPWRAQGSLVVIDGVVIGSELIGQSFARSDHFHARPSATTDTDPADPTKTVSAPYNAASSGGSNLGPTSKALVDRVTADVDALRAEGLTRIPADLVTTSASGLDPHLSPEAALAQVPRVARARGLDEAALRGLVARLVEPRRFGILGEPVVNVLALNRALGALAPAGDAPRPPAR